ncbi:hypothetical protein HYW74_04435 [Candidatus Pacearchaeota archaeon]|nr:hypothetical protein [Candidatus Pacearchaeota archaeon]
MESEIQETRMIVPRGYLRSQYKSSVFQEERIESGRELGYSRIRIKLNELVRGLEKRLSDLLLGNDISPVDSYRYYSN